MGEMKTSVNFNRGFALIGFQTTGPRTTINNENSKGWYICRVL